MMYFNAQRARIPGLGTTSHGWVSTFPLSQKAGRVKTAGVATENCLTGGVHPNFLCLTVAELSCPISLDRFLLRL